MVNRGETRMKAKYGEKSLEKLNTCHPDLIRLFMLVEKRAPFDVTILQGHRPIEVQFELYQQGRSRMGTSWVVTNKSKVVTNVDGHSIKGKHNQTPSLAVDVSPYPVSWKERDAWRFDVLAGVVLACANELEIDIRSGMDWDGDGDRSDQTLVDAPHWELI